MPGWFLVWKQLKNSSASIVPRHILRAGLEVGFGRMWVATASALPELLIHSDSPQGHSESAKSHQGIWCSSDDVFAPGEALKKQKGEVRIQRGPLVADFLYNV